MVTIEISMKTNGAGALETFSFFFLKKVGIKFVLFLYILLKELDARTGGDEGVFLGM